MSVKARLVRADLKRLNDVRNGLGDQAIDYVLEGNNETVLSTLSNSCSGTELGVCSNYWRPDAAVHQRRDMFAYDNPYDIPLMHRYTKALAASCSVLPDSAAGSEKASKLARVFFTEVLSGVALDLQNRSANKLQPMDKNGLGIETARRVVESFDADTIDLIDVLYFKDSRYSHIANASYREQVDMKSLLATEVEAVQEAAKRLSANGRSDLIRDLHSFGLAKSDDYIDFSMQLVSDSAKSVRETASAIVGEFDTAKVEPKAIELLDSGKVGTRAGMVEILSRMGTDGALHALRKHKDKEKTARVISAIESALTASSFSTGSDESSDADSGYQALDGTLVLIPDMKPWPEEKPAEFGKDDKDDLLEIIANENERRKTQNKEFKKFFTGGFVEKKLPKSLADDVINLLNLESSAESQELAQFLYWALGEPWLKKIATRLSAHQTITVALRMNRNLACIIDGNFLGPLGNLVLDFLHSPDGDIRLLETVLIGQKSKTYRGYGADRVESVIEPGDSLRQFLRTDHYYNSGEIRLPKSAIWPYVAENFSVIDEAFGLVAHNTGQLDRVAAIRLLSVLPKTPARYLKHLLEVATGETKAGRQEARDMLSDVAQIREHLRKLLNDSRQVVRAGVAEWIGDRGDTELIPDLKKRLKKEKSELAKAAILTTLDGLGEDLSGYVGPKALLAEAEQGLKKAKFDKLEWLPLEHLSKLRYRDNKEVPPQVPNWWIFLAAKLKQPGGNALFDLYLDRIHPEDVETFSTWILESWCNYDTARPSEDEGNAYASQHAATRYKHSKRWISDYTEERAHADLKREFMSNYPNSGAATKGILALAKQTPPTIAADRVRAYLKNHGSRTSQSSSLLELLASKGDPVSLQVVIAAATRLKQKGVQKFAASLIEKIAEDNSWSLDELADRTTPAAGLDDDGTLELPFGEEGKIYQAFVGNSLTLQIRNPDGKVVKSLPAAKDDVSKASKKQLAASRKELKQVVAMQTERLYEALCIGRRWSVDDWQRDIIEHPVMYRLAERLVWLGLDQEGEQKGSFRPTAEGDFTNADDVEIDIATYDRVALAHDALMTEAEAQQWQTHLKDYEVSSLVTQFGRTSMSIGENQQAETLIEDRKGWVTDTFTIRGMASKLKYERGESMDAGFFNEYLKRFKSAGIVAVIEFTGNCLPEENVPASLVSLSFNRETGDRWSTARLKLSDVPPVLLSECWNDYHSFAAKASFDKDWEKKMPWM